MLFYGTRSFACTVRLPRILLFYGYSPTHTATLYYPTTPFPATTYPPAYHTIYSLPHACYLALPHHFYLHCLPATRNAVTVLSYLRAPRGSALVVNTDAARLTTRFLPACIPRLVVLRAYTPRLTCAGSYLYRAFAYRAACCGFCTVLTAWLAGLRSRHLISPLSYAHRCAATTYTFCGLYSLHTRRPVPPTTSTFHHNMPCHTVIFCAAGCVAIYRAMRSLAASYRYLAATSSHYGSLTLHEHAACFAS